MIRLKIKLPLFNLLSKLIFTALFLLFMPRLIEYLNLRQADNILIDKREEVIDLISKIGIEPFITSDTTASFGSYNILKEEFISLERTDKNADVNYIDVSKRLIEGDEIDYRVLNYSIKVDGINYLLEVGRSLSSIDQTGKNTRSIMIVFLIFIVSITFLTDFQYTRRILKPLDKITSKLKGISTPEIYDRRAIKTTTEDFVLLDKSLTELMEHINSLFKKEKEVTVNISHELMTPVSVLRSKLENLLLSEESTPETVSKIEESLKTLHRLQSLVNSLLMIARIESHQYLRNDSISLRDLLTEITDELFPIAQDAEVTFYYDLPDPLIFNGGNRALIFSMFSNIINNSLKNTIKGGQIKISGSYHRDSYIIEIADTGIGMTEAQLNNVFSRFKTRNASSEDGTGIGLAIAKTIADFHKIDIDVFSKKGEGTKFSFKFPVTS